MSTCIRSYSKINLGLAIGPSRPDGFHALATLYQTLELHDVVTVEARRLAAGPSRIAMTTNNPFVPADARNTAWKMVERALERLGISAEVHIEIDKRLPVRGGLGAGSANAVAALFGLERELDVRLGAAERLELAAEIGSDVPLFLIGGLVLGLGRGEEVYPMPDLPATHCVVAVPDIGVSTPQAFRDWDARAAKESAADALNREPSALTGDPGSDRLIRLSRVFASVLSEPHSSGVSSLGGSLAENPLLALVRTGIENDFEQVVFPQYPSLGDIKRILAGSDQPEQAAVYAALSGSGSAVFGLYATEAAADAALERLKAAGVPGFQTRTLPRAEYWRGRG
jgi:4-diphosphocytidyl-2-C-methyl-D-erythritol kinase